MGGIFICYRREDTGPFARLLSQSLADRFGRDEIYRDLDSMSPGVDFPKAVDRALQTCDAVLVLIGPAWAGPLPGGGRRIDDPEDYPRREAAAALARDDVLVVPVLIEGTPMPRRAELPGPLASLADRHAHKLADEGWADGLRRLVTALESVVVPSTVAQGTPAGASVASPAVDVAPAVDGLRGNEPPELRPRSMRSVLALVGVAVAVTVGLLVRGGGGGGGGGDDPSRDVTAPRGGKCSFGQVVLSAKPGELFINGFSILVSIDNTTKEPLDIPNRGEVVVKDVTRRRLEPTRLSSWPVYYIDDDLPAGSRYEKSLVFEGDELPEPGTPLRVELPVSSGSSSDCLLKHEGFSVPTIGPTGAVGATPPPSTTTPETTASPSTATPGTIAP